MLRHWRHPTYKAATLVLGLWLLFMQCALTYHTASVEKHKPGEQCELCVAAADFASAVPADNSFSLPSFDGASVVGVGSFIVRHLLFVAYAVRAPPLTLPH